jgi:hypothetical protein
MTRFALALQQNSDLRVERDSGEHRPANIAVRHSAEQPAVGISDENDALSVLVNDFDGRPDGAVRSHERKIPVAFHGRAGRR